MSRTVKLGIAIVVVLLLVWADKSRVDYGLEEGAIKIGVLAPLTGPVADFGEETQKGVESVERKAVEYIFEDTACDPKQAVSAFNKLVDTDRVQFLIGPGCGSPQEVVTALIKEKDVLTILPSAAARSLYADSDGKVFQAQYPLEAESKFIAETMDAAGFQHVGLITYQNAFSQTHGVSFREHFDGTGSEVTLLDETTDVVPPILKLKEMEVDAVYATDISFFFGGGLAKMAELGLDVPVYSMYAVELPAVRELVEGVTYSFPGGLEYEHEGAVQGLSAQSATTLSEVVIGCKGEFKCAKSKLDDLSGKGEHEINPRPIILKQIVNGETVKK